MRIKANIYFSYLAVGMAAAILGAIFSGAGALTAGAVVGLVGGFYFAGALAEAVGRAAATARQPADEWGAGAAEEEIFLEPLMSAAFEAGERSKQVIAELTADKQTRDMILDNMRDGVLLTDNSTDVILANPAARKIFRIRESELVGRPLVHVIPSQELDELVREVIAGGEEREADIETVMPRQRHLRAVALPIKDNRGLIGVLAVIHDVTSRERVEAVRRDFVANVSHELKTPVSGISLLSESILTSLDNDPDRTRAFANKLKRETSRLSQLIRDLLDLSQLEAEKLRPISTHISLSEVAGKVVESLMEAAAEGGISLRTELKPDVALTTGNENQLEVMVRNLIDNAVHYTPPGGDILVATDTAGDFVTLIVKDTGLGIPQTDQGRVFERFYRVDKNRSRETGGTGLGLSIVKHVVDNHDGSIKLESTVGLGSKFTVMLPITGT